jgi:hypothetical protein
VNAIAVLLGLLGAYLAIGLAFAVTFAWVGANRIDPHAARSSRGFRVLILPGAMFLWPLLARRWWGGIHEPPEEHNAHRGAANDRPPTNSDPTPR